MWGKGRSVIIIVLSIFLIFLFDGFCTKSKVYSNDTLFDDILKCTKSTIQECDVTATFETNLNGESMCQSIFKKINGKQNFNSNVIQNTEFYRIEFNKKSERGYIQSIKYGKYNVITIDIDELGNKNKLNDLMIQIKESLKNRKESIKYFEYLKAKTTNSNSINECNSQILRLLGSYHISDIDTLNLENGYTSTAYTGLYDNAIEVNNKLVDFNYSVCRYYSGNYIILATPEIIKTY